MEKKYFLEAVEFLNSLSPNENHSINLGKLIRKKFPNWPIPLIGLVNDQSELRKKALKKFSQSQNMLFTRKGLEQSTSETLSLFTASLFKSSDTVLEICSGIGGNTIGLQKKFRQISTVEPDPLLNQIHEHNMRIYYPQNEIMRQVTELQSKHFNDYSNLFIDPDRRSSGKRSHSLEDHSPEIKFILENCKNTKEIIIKLSPMINQDQTEVGFKSIYIAEEMELKQNLWVGGKLNETSLTYAILSNGQIFDSQNLPQSQRLPSSLECIFEVNPAIIKSGESINFARKYQLDSVGEGYKHFIGEGQSLYPFANCWQILLQEDYHPKKLTSILQSLSYERFEIKPIGVEETEVNKLISKWGKGIGKAATVFIFKQKDFKKVIIGEKVTTP